MKNKPPTQIDANQYIDRFVLDFKKGDPQGYTNYQKVLEPLFTLEAECRQPFESFSNTYMFKDLFFADSQANTHQATLTRSVNHNGMVTNDYLLVFFYRDVPISIVTEQGETHVAPEQVVFADLSHPITIHTSSIHVISLNFSRTLISKLIPNTEQLHGAVLRDGPHKSILVNYLNTLTQVASSIQVQHAVNVTQSIMLMVANCLLESAPLSIYKINASQRVTLQQLKQAIDQQIEEPTLSAETLMTQFHLSRATVYRLFKPLGGITKFIKHRKLDYAFTELAKSTETKPNISQLATRLGFTDPTTFTKAFTKKFDIKPSEVRAKTGKRAKQPLPWEYSIDVTPFKTKE